MPSQQFGIRDILKLSVVVAAIFAAAPTVGPYVTIIMLGAVAGMFICEHFANTKASEFLAIIVLPVSCAAFALCLPLMRSSESASPGDYALAAAVGALTGIVPVTMAIVLLSIVSALVYRVTGIRLLKYDWGDSANTEEFEPRDEP